MILTTPRTNTLEVLVYQCMHIAWKQYKAATIKQI
jgi:hypothetical protein